MCFATFHRLYYREHRERLRQTSREQPQDGQRFIRLERRQMIEREANQVDLRPDVRVRQPIGPLTRRLRLSCHVLFYVAAPLSRHAPTAA